MSDQKITAYAKTCAGFLKAIAHGIEDGEIVPSEFNVNGEPEDMRILLGYDASSWSKAQGGLYSKRLELIAQRLAASYETEAGEPLSVRYPSVVDDMEFLLRIMRI